MSAIDFANGSGTQSSANYGASRRYYRAPLPSFPNADWCIGVWFRATRNTDGTTSFPSFVDHTSDVASNPGYKITMVSATNLEYKARVDASTSGTASTHTISFAHGITFDGSDYLLILQRRSGVLQAYCVKEGATASAPNGTATITGTPLPGTIPASGGSGAFIGINNFNFADGMINPMGEFFVVLNDSLSAAEVTTLAAGARPSAANIGTDPTVMLPFRTVDAATETNLGSGGATHNATKFGSTFTTGLADFFSLGGGGQVSQRGGVALSSVSALSGIAKASIAAINGLTI